MASLITLTYVQAKYLHLVSRQIYNCIWGKELNTMSMLHNEFSVQGKWTNIVFLAKFFWLNVECYCITIS